MSTTNIDVWIVIAVAIVVTVTLAI